MAAVHRLRIIFKPNDYRKDRIMRIENQQPRWSHNVELEQAITASLRGQHVPSLRHVRVEAKAGVVVLRGEVTSFHAKQLSHHSARRLAGDSQVIDEVSVVTPAAFRDPLRLNRTAAAGVALILLVLTAGCVEDGPERPATQPVTGQVILQGRPIAGATVVFNAKTPTPGFHSAQAQTDAQGKFKLRSFQPEDGAPVGQYAVTVSLDKYIEKNGDFVLAPSPVPPRYSTPQATPLVAEVIEGPNHIQLRIPR